jgi:8-oxo-dGTP diphosphatase
VSKPLIADPQAHRIGGTDREAVDVAVGVMVRMDGAFLLTTRPEGKAYAGYWEFPGGKVEVGESVVQALHRELLEEIGIVTESVVPWRLEMVDYPHALVRLHFCKVTHWSGELEMREGQQFSWQQLPVKVVPVLPGTLPVLDWLAEERKFSDATVLVATSEAMQPANTQ